jgi:hypothetical protein
MTQKPSGGSLQKFNTFNLNYKLKKKVIMFFLEGQCFASDKVSNL